METNFVLNIKNRRLKRQDDNNLTERIKNFFQIIPITVNSARINCISGVCEVYLGEIMKRKGICYYEQIPKTLFHEALHLALYEPNTCIEESGYYAQEKFVAYLTEELKDCLTF